MEAKEEKHTYKPSGNKNSYYFLNRLILANKEYIPEICQDILQNPFPTHKIHKEKNCQITSKHWKKTVKLLLSKGAQMQPKEFKTVKFLLELTRNPEKFMKDALGKEIINFRSKNSYEIFVLKCKSSIYPWLRAMVIDEFSKREGGDSEGIKEDLLQEILEKQISIKEKERSKKDQIEEESESFEVKIEHETNQEKKKQLVKRKRCSCCKEVKKNVEELNHSLGQMNEAMRMLLNQNKYMMLCLGELMRLNNTEKM